MIDYLYIKKKLLRANPTEPCYYRIKITITFKRMMN
jgi:hypothetical protein